MPNIGFQSSLRKEKAKDETNTTSWPSVRIIETPLCILYLEVIIASDSLYSYLFVQVSQLLPQKSEGNV